MAGYVRTALRWFALANRAYAGATITIYEADTTTGLRTATLATLYDAPSGTGVLANPLTLDAAGAAPSPVYVDSPVVAVIGSDLGTTETGMFVPASGTYRSEWGPAIEYFQNDIVRDGGAGNGTFNVYVAVTPHISTTWAEDLAAGRWGIIVDVASIIAELSGMAIGTVTSVGLSAPAQFVVSGSPVATAGILSLDWAAQPRNLVLAGPTSGGDATPAFRALVAADIAGLETTEIVSTDDSANAGPDYSLYRHPATASDADEIGRLLLQGIDSAGTKRAYAAVAAYIKTVAAANPAAGLALWTMAAGVLAARWKAELGLFYSGGTDKGAGSVNAQSFWLSGASLFATDGERIAQASAAKAITPANLAATPSFMATKGSDQGGISTTVTPTKITFTTEAHDVGGYYDAPNSKWTPPAGRVMISFGATISTTAAGSDCTSYLYKNGSPHRSKRETPAGALWAPGFTTVEDTSGTDYWEVFFLYNLGTKTVLSGAASWFCGAMV